MSSVAPVCETLLVELCPLGAPFGVPLGGVPFGFMSNPCLYIIIITLKLEN